MAVFRGTKSQNNICINLILTIPRVAPRFFVFFILGGQKPRLSRLKSKELSHNATNTQANMQGGLQASGERFNHTAGASKNKQKRKNRSCSKFSVAASPYQPASAVPSHPLMNPHPTHM